MPQLDIYTFWYQYTGVVFLLLLIYATSSYLILPLLLRSILIRVKFFETSTLLSKISTYVSNSQNRFVTVLYLTNKLKIFNLSQINNVLVLHFLKKLNFLVSLVGNVNFSVTSSELEFNTSNVYNKSFSSRACNSYYNSYLSLFLLELTEDKNN